ncbi:MAG: leucine-rich repeat domain-containing protein [Oscillospiraceae bacterium]
MGVDGILINTGFGSGHTVGQNAFSGCKNLNKVKISDGVSSIGDYVFLQCSCINLKSITIPENTTYIGKEAFIECTGLKSVTIPKSVKEIGENALGICFDDDGALKKSPRLQNQMLLRHRSRKVCDRTRRRL